MGTHLRPTKFVKNHHVFLYWNGTAALPPLYALCLRSIVHTFGAERVVIASETLEDAHQGVFIWRDFKEDLFPPKLASRIAKSQFPGPHAADLFRLTVLYKYGGIYTDMDSLWVNAIDIGSNGFVVLTDDKLISNGCIGMRAGDEYLRRVIAHIDSEYNGACWNCIGSKIMTRVYFGECPSCKSRLRTVPYLSMYSVHWTEAKRVMEGDARDYAHVLEGLEDGSHHQLHLFGGMTRAAHRTAFPVNSVYAQVSRLATTDTADATSILPERTGNMRTSK